MTPSKWKGQVTAAELMAELEADPEWVAPRDERERLQQRRIAESYRAAAPLRAELAAVRKEARAALKKIDKA